MITAGIDSGAAATKAVILADGQVVAYIIRPTGFDFQKAADAAYKDALKNSGILKKSFENVCATGYGKNNVKFANSTLSEITAHAKGVGHLMPDAEGIIDIGARTARPS